jgi:predicted amidohydrolase
MSKAEQECAWQQIKRAFRGFQGLDPKPDVLLLPELAVPRGSVGDLQRLGRGLDAIIIAGVDYRLDDERHLVWNEAVLIPPPPQNGNKQRMPVWIGKTWPAPKERKGLESFTPKWTFQGDPVLWLFRGSRTGDFAVAICYDLMDLERALLYRGRIHHLFVLAYNQDTGSFHHHAESFMRSMYCNLVICNTGFYGGSVAVAPFWEPYKRMVYRHDGGGMVAAQLISLPLRQLDLWQRRTTSQNSGRVEDKLKALPPNYQRL